LRIVALLLAAAAAGAGFAADTVLGPLAGPGEAPGPTWRVVGLPGQTKPYTRFTTVTLDGERVLRVEATASYGNLVHDFTTPPAAWRLKWRWRLDVPNPQSDLTKREADDTPVKVCALFDLPLAAVPFVERQLLRVARLRAGEDLTAANVCYVWDARLAAGTVLENAFTRRLRFIVLRGPETPLHTWIEEQRDVRADFMRLFADESRGQLPPLVGIAVGADADNTRGHSVAHVADIELY
jgi:hypothetical protein